MNSTLYTHGKYLELNPTWHAEDSSWKARHIAAMLKQHAINPKSIVEVGSGAGEILVELAKLLPNVKNLNGYEISPQAFERSKHHESERIKFFLGDFFTFSRSGTHDVTLVIDVVEHVEDCFGLARSLQGRGRYTIFHFPLDLSVQALWRGTPLLKNRHDVGHIHYFSKETALALLQDTGYEIVDWVYTATTIDLPARSSLSWMARFPRRLLFSVAPDFAVRLLGGYSLLVLAR